MQHQYNSPHQEAIKHSKINKSTASDKINIRLLRLFGIINLAQLYTLALKTTIIAIHITKLFNIILIPIPNKNNNSALTDFTSLYISQNTREDHTSIYNKQHSTHHYTTQL